MRSLGMLCSVALSNKLNWTSSGVEHARLMTWRVPVWINTPASSINDSNMKGYTIVGGVECARPTNSVSIIGVFQIKYTAAINLYRHATKYHTAVQPSVASQIFESHKIRSELGGPPSVRRFHINLVSESL